MGNDARPLVVIEPPPEAIVAFYKRIGIEASIDPERPHVVLVTLPAPTPCLVIETMVGLGFEPERDDVPDYDELGWGDA